MARRTREERIRILEIGTWKGVRAKEMITHILNTGFKVDYYGIDLFEDLTDEGKETEFCGKSKPPPVSVVKAMLDKISKDAVIMLFKGDSRQLLPDMLKTIKNNIGYHFDLIFVDGGHSIETISSDFMNCIHVLRSDGILVMDDYYDEREDVGSKNLFANYLYENSNYESEITQPGDYDANTQLTIHLVIVRHA